MQRPIICASRRLRLFRMVLVIVATIAAVITADGSALAAPNASRIFGADRYATSAAVSAANFTPGVPAVYIATGTNFPDALAGGAAAANGGGPLLLVQPTAVPPPIAAELERLQPGKIVILGGTGAISATVATSLAAYTTGTVTRVAGADRYATAAALAAGFPAGTPVYIATGTNFPDALSATAAAAATHAAILLTTPGDLPAATKDALAALRPISITIAGAATAVSQQVQAELATYSPAVTRVSGADRYATAAAIAAVAFPGATSAFVTSGEGFADALTGGPVAGLHGQPLLLSSALCVPKPTFDASTNVTTVTLLGGPSTLGQGVATWTLCGAIPATAGHLYYQSCSRQNESAGCGGSVMRANLDGSNPVAVEPQTEVATPFTVAADGSAIIREEYSPDGGIALYRYDVGSQTSARLTTFDPGHINADESPTISPDGTTVAFRRSGVLGTCACYGSSGIGVVNVDGSNLHLLSTDTRIIELGTFNPDSTQFLAILSGNVIGQNKVISIAVATGAQNVIYAAPSAQAPQPDSVGWSADGATVAFTASTSLGQSSGLYVIPVTGGPPKLLATTPSGCSLGQPHFSLDDTFIVADDSCYVSGERSSVFRFDLRTGASTIIPGPAGNDAWWPVVAQ